MAQQDEGNMFKTQHWHGHYYGVWYDTDTSLNELGAQEDMCIFKYILEQWVRDDGCILKKSSHLALIQFYWWQSEITFSILSATEMNSWKNKKLNPDQNFLESGSDSERLGRKMFLENGVMIQNKLEH